MSDDGLWAEGFTTLSARLRGGELSSVDLIALVLDRIARYDGALHSYQAIATETACAAARDAQAEIRAGRWRGPLHGIPIAVKDVFYTMAIRTGLGSSIYSDWTPPHDSTATQRLEAAGAILIGKLTATEGVYADHHPTIAPPLNPFGADHWTGTSSSGSGVAVTAGLCYGTLGSDTGGSIRLPSACCGVVGIKPTWGRVSRHGVFPLAESLDHVGPMARTAADAAALLQVIAGPDPADPTASPLPVQDYLATLADGIAGLRIGVDWAFVAAKSDAEVMASLRSVAQVLADLGAHLIDVTVPPVEPVLRGWAVQCAVEAALAHRDTYPARKAEYGARLAALLDRGQRFTAEDMAIALRDRRDFTGRMARLFASINLMILPALPVAGPSLAHMASLGEDPDGILAIGPFTAPFDVCGYPTITLPCGASPRGIPVGFQVVAKPFAEDLLCRAGHAYQSRTDWHARRPDLQAFDCRNGVFR